MALALSVKDGNGAVSSFANQPRSCVGREARGYWAPRASGPEKSRHTKHSVVGLGGCAAPGEEPWNFGLVA